MYTDEYIVGVVGSGVMGTGLVQVLATSPKVKKIYWCSARNMNLDDSKSDLIKRLNLLVRKQRLDANLVEGVQDRILLIKDMQELHNCRFIHEVTMESTPVKTSLLERLNSIKSPEAIVASNTSSISITELGMSLTDPTKFIGMHFFNPAPIMKLVEVVRGYFTSLETESVTKMYAEALGKTPVVVADAPGFIVNRMLMPMINEAVCILADNVATKECIDMAMKLGANHPIGPLALSDMIGNDVVLSIMEVLYSETGDQKYRPHPLLRKMVRAGRLGKKTSYGFYDY